MTLKELAQQYIKWKYADTSVPDYALPKKTYSDKTANGLTKAIIDYIRMNGGYADRINNTGVYVKGKTTDLGHEVLMERGKYIRSGSRKGIADIMATKKGRLVAIEVKIGKDRQSEHQKLIECEINQAGGVYMIARTWTQFYEQWKQIANIQ